MVLSSWLIAFKESIDVLVWRAICQSKEAIKYGPKWCVRDGKSINVFSDSWISEVPLEREVWTTTCTSEVEVLHVDQLITPDKE